MDLTTLLRDFHREKLTLRERHVAVARQVGDYEFNNTYQYVINREDVHLSWLEGAIADLGGEPETVAPIELPARGKKDSVAPLVSEDARELDAFVTRWRPRIGEVTHARHRTMLQVVLGETSEQKRFFDQIAAGRRDVLGRRSNGAGSPGTGDGVIDRRWIE